MTHQHADTAGTGYPVQLDLPGQTHVADGPHDQSGMYVMHHAFRRDLARFESAVRNTPVGDADTWRALATRWAAFTDVLHHHHTIEDEAIWPLVIERAEERGDAEDVETLEAMEAEHDTIDPGLAACTEGFAAMIEHPCADHRNALDVRVTDLRAGLLDHLRHEETGALPLIQQLLSEEEFAGTERAAGKGYPLRRIPFILPWAMDGLPDDVVTRFLSNNAPQFKPFLRLLRPRYQRGEAKAFRYA